MFFDSDAKIELKCNAYKQIKTIKVLVFSIVCEL